MSMPEPMRLVVYGDYNCPYSCLANSRVDMLSKRGLVEVEWRAVEHDPDIPAPSEPVDGELAAMLDREVDEVRGLLRPGEDFSIRRPRFHPNTAAAVAAFAAARPGDEHELRRRLFAALWSDDLDIGEPDVVRELAGTSTGVDAERRVEGWRSEWLRLERRVVPMLVLPDGYVSRGLGALARLADLAG